MKKQSERSVFKQLDHLAIVVPDTDTALKIWRDKFGFPVVASERVNHEAVLLTHLDLGNTHLQLVQPLVDDHPLWAWLQANGPGLHHFCLAVDDVGAALAETQKLNLPAAQDKPHEGIRGKRAAFLDKEQTGHIQVEVTGA